MRSTPVEEQTSIYFPWEVARRHRKVSTDCRLMKADDFIFSFYSRNTSPPPFCVTHSNLVLYWPIHWPSFLCLCNTSSIVLFGTKWSQNWKRMTERLFWVLWNEDFKDKQPNPVALTPCYRRKRDRAVKRSVLTSLRLSTMLIYPWFTDIKITLGDIM